MDIKLLEKRKKNGETSLFMSYYVNGVQKTEDLHINLCEDNKSSETIQNNEDKRLLAKFICAKREWELIARDNEIDEPYPHKPPVLLTSIIQRFISQYTSKDIKVALAMQKKLIAFVGHSKVQLTDVDVPFCRKFYRYLSVRLNGNTPQGYFKKFSMCLNLCVEERLIPDNPARHIRLVSSDEFVKDVLSMEEINLIATTPYHIKYREVKRAFLFACNTGLRWCDLSSLRYSSVDYDNRMLHLVQKKVSQHSKKAILHLNLNSTAMKILRMSSGERNEKVFKMHSYNYSLPQLAEIVKLAGIKKHITFHCGRHSFITNIISHGADIKTAAELAGHSSIRHTEKYVHLVNELKRKAVDSLEEVDIVE